MQERVQIWRRPTSRRLYMLVGWEQWADAGSISSGLPIYLIQQNEAEQIGELLVDDCYLFQLPGTHHLLRPEVKLVDGLADSMSERTNEFYFMGNDDVGLILFAGEEPHLNERAYTGALLDAAESWGVQRIISVGGVYGSMPYDRDREISSSFSLERMRGELEQYALRFSNYRGGTTIGTYLVYEARRRGMECMTLYGFVPAYEFPHMGGPTQGLRIDVDYKSWYDIMRRVNHMCNLGLSLAELGRLSDELTTTIEQDLSELIRDMPQLNIDEYMRQLSAEFTERSFMPLDDVWAEELGNLFDDMDD